MSSKTIEGEFDAPKTALELETLVRGVFEKANGFSISSSTSSSSKTIPTPRGAQADGGDAIISSTPPKPPSMKRSHATGKDRTGEPEGTYWAGKMQGGAEGDRRVGVIWHTQGDFNIRYYSRRQWPRHRRRESAGRDDFSRWSSFDFPGNNRPGWTSHSIAFYTPPA